MRDKKGYNFDAVTPRILAMRANVKDGKIAFPSCPAKLEERSGEGTSYSVLVLPNVETMTPQGLQKVIDLVKAGATVVGNPPRKSPSLVGYPACDQQVQQLAAELWGDQPVAERRVGKGRVLLNSSAQTKVVNELSLADSGNWIWFNKGFPSHDAAGGNVHFRYSWDVRDVRSLKAALIMATADNSFTLKVNGKLVLKGSDWQKIQQAQILSVLRNGPNTIDVVATNDAQGPAGFIAAIQLINADGTSQEFGSDASWQASLDGTSWSVAKKLGRGTMGPWGLKGTRSADSGLYPDYSETAEVLREMGITEDFISDGPIRYGHRRTENEEIYFVANTANKKVETTCRFRVENGRPELWDPMTAEMRPLATFTHEDKVTSIPMTFDAHQSFFVIFQRNAKPKVGTTSANFSKMVALQTLSGPWEVAFDPKWGGPEKVKFEELQDWSKHSERGIRYYSGSATYRKSFDRSEGVDANAAVYLDLGTVRDICRVRLNGQDLGILWTAPWRVEITDVVKAKGNELEIEVVNRWINRLVGDQQPEDKEVRTLQWESGLLSGKSFKTGRYTYSTHSPYKADSNLLPSGLIGPVRIVSSK